MAKKRPTTNGNAGTKRTTKDRGDVAESIAADYLVAEGWRVLDRNVNFRVGELDIVADDGEQLVFVEVRSRFTRSGPRPQHTVTFPKQRKLTAAALLYLNHYNGPRLSSRFDVIGVDANRGTIVAHHVGAFDAADY